MLFCALTYTLAVDHTERDLLKADKSEYGNIIRTKREAEAMSQGELAAQLLIWLCKATTISITTLGRLAAEGPIYINQSEVRQITAEAHSALGRFATNMTLVRAVATIDSPHLLVTAKGRQRLAAAYAVPPDLNNFLDDVSEEFARLRSRVAALESNRALIKPVEMKAIQDILRIGDDPYRVVLRHAFAKDDKPESDALTMPQRPRAEGWNQEHSFAMVPFRGLTGSPFEPQDPNYDDPATKGGQMGIPSFMASPEVFAVRCSLGFRGDVGTDTDYLVIDPKLPPRSGVVDLFQLEGSHMGAAAMDWDGIRLLYGLVLPLDEDRRSEIQSELRRIDSVAERDYYRNILGAGDDERLLHIRLFHYRNKVNETLYRGELRLFEASKEAQRLGTVVGAVEDWHGWGRVSVRFCYRGLEATPARLKEAQLDADREEENRRAERNFISTLEMESQGRFRKL